MLRARSLKSGVEGLAYWSGLAGRRARGRGARVVMFHGTPQTRAAQFERQLRYLRRQFKIVPLSELVQRLKSAPQTLDGLVAVTFDDGIRNNVTVAYPILRRLRIPATFFVCPGLIEGRRWLWNCEARQRLRYAGEGVRRELAGHYGIDAGTECIVEWMKTLDTARRQRAEAQIRAATPGYAPSARERHELDLAGWSDLRSLDPAQIEIGSHTLHHPILTCMAAEAVQRELRESRRVLEERLQRPVETLAYPNGNTSPQVRDIARQHYGAAFAGGETFIEKTAALDAIPRFSAAPDVLRFALRMNRRPVPSEGDARTATDGVRVTRPVQA